MINYFIRIVGTAKDDSSVDVRISGIYQFQNSNDILIKKLMEEFLEEAKKIDNRVDFIDITTINAL